MYNGLRGTAAAAAAGITSLQAAPLVPQAMAHAENHRQVMQQEIRETVVMGHVSGSSLMHRGRPETATLGLLRINPLYLYCITRFHIILCEFTLYGKSQAIGGLARLPTPTIRNIVDPSDIRRPTIRASPQIIKATTIALLSGENPDPPGFR